MFGKNNKDDNENAILKNEDEKAEEKNDDQSSDIKEGEFRDMLNNLNNGGNPESKQHELKFYGYVIDDIKFKINKASNEQQIPLKLAFNNNISTDNKFWFVTLSVNVFEENFDDLKNPFFLTLAVTGRFTIDNCSDAERTQILRVNATEILFPYLRAAVTNITSTANIKPLILPVINVGQSFVQNAENTIKQ